jgi:murein DD-endopeptidase MepM/ murein hydrolase activator NlpD
MLSTIALGVCLALPSNATVVDPFRAPECARCAGNRGIEYAVPANAVVRSGLRGEVVFVGMVANVRYVVVRASADPRVRVTYGGLADVVVSQGEELRRGDALGTMGESDARGSGDARGIGRLHLGVRVGDEYMDPLVVARGSAAKPRFRVTLGRGPTSNCVRGP